MRKTSGSDMMALTDKYKRISGNVDFGLLFKTTLIIVGTGGSSAMIEAFSRMGIKSLILFDHDHVEEKNLTCQNFKHSDTGRLKTHALKDRLYDCEFEKGNAEIPSLKVDCYNNFLEVSDSELDGIILAEKRRGQKPVLIMATDYHPAQARGNRVSLKHQIMAFWIGIYKGGMAGEVIFFIPEEKNLACYRCIAAGRYKYFNKHHLTKHLKGNFSSFGVSAGLPFALSFVDSILGHLIIGAIHKDIERNSHGKLFKRLIAENRSLIQTQLSPEYRLKGDVDIFQQFNSPEILPDIITFNTLFQREQKVENCPDCFNPDKKWEHTDYTKEYSAL